MVTKKRGRYEMIDKAGMNKTLEENLHTSGTNIGKPNFSLVEKLHPEFYKKNIKNLVQ